MDSMYDPGDKTSTDPSKHKEEGKKRQQDDKEDRQKILNELQKHSHPLLDQSPSLFNIVNGHVAPAEVNVQDAVAIGCDMQKDFAASLPGGFHNPIKIKKKTKTMQILKHGVKVKDKIVYDLEALFTRLLLIGQKQEIE